MTKFYTKLTDIEKELRHHKKHFEDKIVFCNCDDLAQSNFSQKIKYLKNEYSNCAFLFVKNNISAARINNKKVFRKEKTNGTNYQFFIG